MPNVAIRVEGLSKSYRITRARGRSSYKTVQEDLLSLPGRAARALRRAAASEPGRERFWALDDVSCEVAEGEVLGIIGRNGAGKSTLLKILSRITEPTKGCAELYGRVGSLLEVGTGFHPELTGRENIYLSGAILGMRRREITRRFDQIVEFAEIERFVDTPVKRYSSGMYMRLAFSVAAHLDPEIMVVDEVLAVGDQAFQDKCLGKMSDVARSGRTILFVSHNMGAIRALCQSAIWLDSGGIVQSGEVSAVTEAYSSSLATRMPTREVGRAQHREGTGQVSIQSAFLTDDRNGEKNSFLIGEPFNLHLGFAVDEPISGTFWLLLWSGDVVVLSSLQRDIVPPVFISADGKAVARIEGVDLLPGRYSFSAGIFESGGAIVDWADDIADFEILPHFVDGRPYDSRYGLISKAMEWTLDAPTSMSVT
jgi:lipopolysaccharide transport system ATP-binding protein